MCVKLCAVLGPTVTSQDSTGISCDLCRRPEVHDPLEEVGHDCTQAWLWGAPHMY